LDKVWTSGMETDKVWIRSGLVGWRRTRFG
jgi:hypothetical protein